jgi:hypothetical protein
MEDQLLFDKSQLEIVVEKFLYSVLRFGHIYAYKKKK